MLSLCFVNKPSYMCFMYVYADGIEFFWSDNGVLLTAGDDEGKLIPKYFIRALRLRPTSKKMYHISPNTFHLII